MPHLIIIFQISIILVGAIINYYFYSKYRHTNNQILHAVFYLIAFINADAVVQFISNYFYLNIHVISHRGVDARNLITFLMIYIIRTLILFLFLRFIFMLKEIKIDSRYYKVYFSFVFLFGLAYVGGLFEFFYENKYIHFCSNQVLRLISVFLMFLSSIFLLYKNKLSANSQKKDSIFFLLTWFSAGSLLLIIFEIVKMSYDAVSILVRLLLILTLLRWYLKYFHINTDILSSLSQKDIQTIISDNYSLSNREREILYLILKGFNNKEIEKNLFLSSSTVRSHVSSIYKKTGVKHRGQLFQLFSGN